jgi:hypothetical protein
MMVSCKIVLNSLFAIYSIQFTDKKEIHGNRRIQIVWAENFMELVQYNLNVIPPGSGINVEVVDKFYF